MTFSQDSGNTGKGKVIEAREVILSPSAMHVTGIFRAHPPPDPFPTIQPQDMKQWRLVLSYSCGFDLTDEATQVVKEGIET